MPDPVWLTTGSGAKTWCYPNSQEVGLGEIKTKRVIRWVPAVVWKACSILSVRILMHPPGGCPETHVSKADGAGTSQHPLPSHGTFQQCFLSRPCTRSPSPTPGLLAQNLPSVVRSGKPSLTAFEGLSRPSSLCPRLEFTDWAGQPDFPSSVSG